MRTLILAAALLGTAGASLADGLDIINGEHCRRLDLPDGRFAVTYHHSMYDQPVTEEFAIEGGGLTLRRLESPSAAVLEYFGVTAPGSAHALDRPLPEIVMRVAMGAAQVLHIDGATLSLREFGGPGDRILIRAAASHDCMGRGHG